MYLDFTVSVEETPDTIVLTINGDGGGLLIGKRGRTWMPSSTSSTRRPRKSMMNAN
jgi:hypothetical protein